MSLDTVREQVAHQQQRDHLRHAYARLDTLLDQQDRLERIPSYRWPEGRAGQLTVAIRDARQRLAELEAIAAVERDFNLPPTLDPAPEPTRRPGQPAWKL